MNFREWLVNLEEGSQRGRQTSGNQDMTRGLGPTSQYGQSAMMPVSIGIDNRAAAGIIDGIGYARADIRARKGAEPGVASQYHLWQDIRREGITAIYLPLQLPGERSGVSRPISNSKTLVHRLKTVGDPLDNPEVWRVDVESMRLLGEPTGENPNRLYVSEKDPKEGDQDFSDAKEFTTALMMASIAKRLEKYSHALNIDRPRIKDQRIEYFPLGKDEKNEKKDVYYAVMMCSFVLTSKHRDQEISGELRDEIERVLSGDEDGSSRVRKSSQTAISPEDRERNLNALRGSTRNNVSPVTTNRGNNP